MNDRLQISRGNTELGSLTKDDALNLHQVGFLLPTDLWRNEGTAGWTPMSELRAAHSSETSVASVAQVVKKRIAAARDSFSETATQATNRLKQVAGHGQGRLTAATSQLLDSFTPQIQTLVAQQLIKYPAQSVRNALRDDAFIQKLFGATYDCLPKPVCRFISEPAFVQFCMDRKRKLVPDDPNSPGVGC